MKINWFGLSPIHQILYIYKRKRRKVEETVDSSSLEKENEKDTFDIRRDNEKGR